MTLRDTQAFFATRAAGWETRFPGDEPRYEQAIHELAPPLGGRVLDAGCGTGRALPFLRNAVGAAGEVVALDLTPEMLAEARRLGRGKLAHLLAGDGERLPFATGTFQAIFAAGFVPHLLDPEGGLTKLARIGAPGARLAIFHPIGRATLAARHGGIPSDDDAVAPARLRTLLPKAGWTLESIDDGPDRYLALAYRV
ncbi:MAG: class I SAM-dependent methyltransferase [Chloroflexota bacterium]